MQNIYLKCSFFTLAIAYNSLLVGSIEKYRQHLQQLPIPNYRHNSKNMPFYLKNKTCFSYKIQYKQA